MLSTHFILLEKIVSLRLPPSPPPSPCSLTAFWTVALLNIHSEDNGQWWWGARNELKLVKFPLPFMWYYLLSNPGGTIEKKYLTSCSPIRKVVFCILNKIIFKKLYIFTNYSGNIWIWDFEGLNIIAFSLLLACLKSSRSSVFLSFKWTVYWVVIFQNKPTNKQQTLLYFF